MPRKQFGTEEFAESNYRGKNRHILHVNLPHCNEKRPTAYPGVNNSFLPSHVEGCENTALTVVHDGDDDSFARVAQLPGLGHVQVQPGGPIGLTRVYLLSQRTGTASPFAQNCPLEMQGVNGESFVEEKGEEAKCQRHTSSSHRPGKVTLASQGRQWEEETRKPGDGHGRAG